MRRKTKFLSIFITLLIILLSVDISKAAVLVPENIKIGLFYGSSAASIFSMSAEKGIRVGFAKDGIFYQVVEVPSGKLSIRKDSYYNRSGSSFVETGSSAAASSADRMGPYHIQIGQVYGDAASANQQVLSMAQKGIEAYPVYNGTYQVWTGFYISQDEAQKDLNATISKKLGNVSFTVVKPSENRVVAVSSTGKCLLMVENGTGVFQAFPKAENNPQIFKLNNSVYRGGVEVRRYSESDMTVINVLPLEHYLYGVVPAEIENGAPAEAVKAQSIAARTFALNSLGYYSKWGFDMDATTRFQVYKGYSVENSGVIKAVDETRGKKITYDGKAAQVFYYSSSGGRTEDIKNVWGSSLPYLKSVEDKYESGKSYNYNWEVFLTPSKVKELLAEDGYDVGDIIGIAISKTSDAGRVTALVISGTKDKKTFTLSACRSVLNLPSQSYTISAGASAADNQSIRIKGRDGIVTTAISSGKKLMTAEGLKTLGMSRLTIIGSNNQKNVLEPAAQTVASLGDGFRIKGKGWGHGIGMSQEGAKGMASAGFNAEQILTHYFQGTKVE